MRGERAPATLPIEANFGSSPHARGTRTTEIHARNPRRFIPACAGNARQAGSIHPCPSVHPRMRGERPSGPDGHAYDDGSSPHARGTQQPEPDPAGQGRFIPACAGNALQGLIPLGVNPVHPRMRGERRNALHGLGHHVRFIPACAGNARKARTRRKPPSVHPRMRGERRSR